MTKTANYTICEDCRKLRKAADQLSTKRGTLSDKARGTQLENLFFAIRRCEVCKGQGIVRTPESYICNKCGESLCPTPDLPHPYGLVETSVSGGWYSTHLFDLTTYTFSLCEACLRNLFGTFIVKPKVFASVGGPTTYAKDVATYKKSSRGVEETKKISRKPKNG